MLFYRNDEGASAFHLAIHRSDWHRGNMQYLASRGDLTGGNIFSIAPESRTL